jgi:Xaa-Pro aminopeptidase
MVGWFAEEGLVSDSAPVVAAAVNSADPHYLPTLTGCRTIARGDVVLLDLWGRLDEPGTVFADITWVGIAEREVPSPVRQVFETIRDARDAAATLVQTEIQAGNPVCGWQVDRAARRIIDSAGFGDRFVHRTGHSLGIDVHGSGVHMDDYETHDDRRLLPGTGFTIEPGIYLDAWGLRTEINMYVGDGDATISGPTQTDVIPLLAS